MKKLMKTLSAATAAAVAAMMMTLTVFAADYEFDTSGASQSTGSWGQSFIYYTGLESGAVPQGGFDPTSMTSDSEVIVEYTYEGTANADLGPVELIWQTWEGGAAGTDPDVKSTWNKIHPYEFNETTAKFSYADIVSVYGTDNFETVYAVCVGDTGVKLTLTSMNVTNVGEGKMPAAEETTADETESEESETEAEETEAESEETEAEETEAEEEETTVKETEETKKETTEKVTTAAEDEEAPVITSAPSVADNAPKDDATGTIITVGIIAAVVVAAAVVFIVMIIKKSKGRYY